MITLRGYNMSRRRFLFRCLGISTVLGAEAIRPQVSISSVPQNFADREKEETPDVKLIGIKVA